MRTFFKKLFKLLTMLIILFIFTFYAVINFTFSPYRPPSETVYYSNQISDGEMDIVTLSPDSTMTVYRILEDDSHPECPCYWYSTYGIKGVYVHHLWGSVYFKSNSILGFCIAPKNTTPLEAEIKCTQTYSKYIENGEDLSNETFRDILYFSDNKFIFNEKTLYKVDSIPEETINTIKNDINKSP